MKSMLDGIRNIVGWLAIIYGALTIGFTIPDLYLVLVDGAKPGEPIYLDHLALNPYQSAKYIILGLVLIVIGFFIKPKKVKSSEVIESGIEN
jgi:hypothetical protein